MIIDKGSYGKYYSPTGHINTTYITIGTTKIYYSYDTIIAFSHHSQPLYMIENLWGPTTGKHMNWIKRHHIDYKVLPRHEFENKLSQLPQLLTKKLLTTLTDADFMEEFDQRSKCHLKLAA
jgi:hypothetical protein